MIPSSCGLHLSVWTADAIDTLDTTRRAREAGVAIYPLSMFRTAEGPDGLIIGYGAIPLPHIDEALHRLHLALPH
jgi:GntR family transcriptional regulator/MocR family aminotransferase